MPTEQVRDDAQSREQQINKIMESAMPEAVTRIKNTLRNLFQQERSAIEQSFAYVLGEGFDEVRAQQPFKGKIQYITVSSLLSSLLLNRWEYRLDFHNRRGFEDQNETAVYWQPKFFLRFWQEEQNQAAALLRSELMRVKDYEIQRLTQRLASLYYDEINQTLLAELFSNYDWFANQAIFEDQFQIMYGAYQGTPTLLLEFVLQEREA